MENLLTKSPVLIIGTGLLGTSVALRLTAAGIAVHLEDASPVAQRLAHDLGGGSLAPVANPHMVVVAVPPDVTAVVVRAVLNKYPHAIVTDVASVKEPIRAELADHPEISRWVGSHPMAGKEHSGAIAADADLFIGRPWVIIPNEKSEPQAITAIKTLAVDMGATPITMGAKEHDHSVAVISHMPQLMSSLVAGALRHESAAALSLSGQGLRDVTRIAESDPQLWTAIINGNRKEIAGVLRKINARLGRLISALDQPAGGLDQVSTVITDGNHGVALIPGKHGGARAQYAEVTVLVPDQPGELGRLFGEVGEIGVNIEDMMMEHSEQQPVGRAILSVNPAEAHRLERGLTERGWRVVSGAAPNPDPLLIAIDGPSGSGKSTVARRVAEQLDLAYLDTGAMYRAATWWALDQGIDLEDAPRVTAAVETMPLEISLDPSAQTLSCRGVDITDAIRTSDISKVVSKVSTIIPVRTELIRRQQAIISAEESGGYSEGRGIVVEGRDINTVVAPDADVRVLLTASEAARLARRAKEVRGSDSAEAIAQTRDEVVRRDRDDSTVVNFMTAADGVVTIDSSNLSIDQTVQAVLDLVPRSDHA